MTIDPAIAISESKRDGRAFIREPWVILKGSAFERNFIPPKVGPDYLDCVLILPTLGDPTKEFIRLPGVNVNSSSTSRTFKELADGAYLYVAGFHRWSEPSKRYRAFFIMKYEADFPLFSTIQDAYISPRRLNLPVCDGGKDSYYNFHRSNVHSDGSEGCWTANPKQFDLFRADYKDLQVGLVFKSTTEPQYGLEAIKAIRSL